MAEEKLQGLLNIPQQAQRFITNPTAFLGLLGQNPLPRESGFAEGFGQLPAQTDMSVLDPSQAAYMGGYESGVPVGLLASIAPFTKGMPVGASIKDVSKETANAMKLAQKNAALPIEKGGLGLPKNNTPMDRAKAMGYDMPMYHGTDTPFIEAFDPEVTKIIKGIFSTNNPKTASKYAEEAGLKKRAESMGMESSPNVLPLLIRSEAHKRMPRFDVKTINDFRNNENKGVYRDEMGVAVTFDPSEIRSRFAAFDPMQKKSRNIMAGLIPFGLLSGYEEE
jgi:hypothetical protein